MTMKVLGGGNMPDNWTRFVRYIVIGGMGMIQQGYVRATEDIDLFLNDDQEDIARVIDALAFLPDNAVREITPDDLQKYVVVRVADVKR